MSINTAIMPKIAIVGTQGCGKTVFITTLAQRLGVFDEAHGFLKPSNAKTMKYINSNWNLLSNGEWPRSTHAGDSFALTWDYTNTAGEQFRLHVVDMAGHDLRRIFADDAIFDTASLPEAIRPLAEYCTSADMVLFLVNLGDFVGVSPGDRMENEAALMCTMDHLTHHHRKCCLVFSQWDQHQIYVESRGGLEPVLKACMPIIHGTYLAARSTASAQVATLTVAAVADTEVIHDAGGTRLVPARNFNSKGIQDVVYWLDKSTCDIYKTTVEVTIKPATNNDAKALEQTPNTSKVVLGIITAILTLIGTYYKLKLLQPPKPVPLIPYYMLIK